MERVIYSVQDINKYIKNVLTTDENLKFIYVKGEISNFKKAATGHLYFSLKDNESIINVVMFNNYASKIIFEPKNGDEVIVLASIDAYVPRGNYQLFVYEMNLKGQGSILEELEKLKKKLASEGLFDEDRKRKINIYPHAIGIITAKGSAAIKDLTYNILRRYPLADIYFFPSSVQGENAPKELLEAFKKSQEYPLDTLIIGRGGGASEDLSAFNDEALVRAVATSKMPVIAAVGHEIDSTLIDYVADKRASTPTGAAELATIDQREIIQKLDYYLTDMKSSLENKLSSMNEDIAFYKEGLKNSLLNRLNNYRTRLEGEIKRINALNPKAVLNRGYSLLQNDKGHVITSIKEVKENEIIITSLQDGSIKSIVKEVKNDGR
ncbi:MAG: exodeoxyribonuclease VII large subunit [Erysipelotrichaceae bacterium]|nr:exodeoxyribonuclease VII large subunit [Erysipelotrichaceae bacterium]